MAIPLSVSDHKTPNNTNVVSSTFHKTVCLDDWWLIECEEFDGKKLGVAGFTSKEQKAVRKFCSAPIIKRFDLTTFETADGITVLIKGFVNRSRTHENGFSYEFCRYFLFGFPYNWAAQADLCFGKESSSTSMFHTSICCLSTKPDNFEHGGSKQFETEILKENLFTGKPVRLDNVEIHITKKASNGHEIGGTDVPLSTLNRNDSACFAKHLNSCKDLTQKDDSVPIVSDVKNVIPKNTLMGVSAGNSIAYITRSSKILGNLSNGHDSKKDINRVKSKSLNTSSRVPKDYVVTPSEINVIVSLKSSSSYRRTSSRKLESSNEKKGQNDLKTSVAVEGLDEKLWISPAKTVKKVKSVKEVMSLPLTRSRTPSNFVSLESLSNKKSRSGRLLVPPVQFWQNQQLIYDREGRVAGFQDGLPVIASPTGIIFEPPRKRKKLI